MTGAPDFVEPVVGYRAWHVDDDGLLRPWTFTALPWEAGVTTAVCARDHRHRPPVADCMCGLYALTDPSDRRLHLQGDQAVGAIAAWGELEVHRTGFRAEQACVVALAVPDRAGDDVRARLERAAGRYGVPLVAPGALSAEALRHGAPLPNDLWGPPPRFGLGAPRRSAHVPAVEPGAFGAPARGIAFDAHLWVETALGSVVVGLTRALAQRLSDAPALGLPEAGLDLSTGDGLALVDGAFSLFAPVAGRVLAVNPKLTEDPGLLARDPEGAGWLLRLAPRDWERDAGAVTWGAAAGRKYAAALERDQLTRGDAFADVRLERLRAMPPVRSAADVRAALEAEAAAPRFADAAAVDVELGGRVRDALAEDPALRATLGRLDQVVRFTLRDPAAAVTLDLRGGGAQLAPGVEPDLVLECDAEDAYRWFTGTLDAASALRCGDLRSDAPPGPTLRALAVLKHLRIDGWVPAPTWAR